MGISGVTVTTTVALAACAGFAMPVATPANAIAYGTGLAPLRRMIRLGIFMGAALVALAVGRCARAKGSARRQRLVHQFDLRVDHIVGRSDRSMRGNWSECTHATPSCESSAALEMPVPAWCTSGARG